MRMTDAPAAMPVPLYDRPTAPPLAPMSTVSLASTLTLPAFWPLLPMVPPLMRATVVFLMLVTTALPAKDSEADAAPATTMDSMFVLLSALTAIAPVLFTVEPRISALVVFSSRATPTDAAPAPPPNASPPAARKMLVSWSALTVRLPPLVVVLLT